MLRRIVPFDRFGDLTKLVPTNAFADMQRTAETVRLSMPVFPRWIRVFSAELAMTGHKQLRLRERGGALRDVPVDHTAERYLDAYVEAAGIAAQPASPLRRTKQAADRRLGSWPQLARLRTRAATCCSDAQPVVASRSFVDAFGVGGCVNLPRQQRQSFSSMA